MEQSTLSTFFTNDEIEIAHILLNLPHLIFKSESNYRFAVRWGHKRRRSAIDLSPSPSPSPSLQKRERETERRPKVKAANASSPATPLSLPPSESDEKSNQSFQNVSTKRTRVEWLGIIDGLVERRELLRGEIENVKSYYNKLKAFNLELKAKKQELRFRYRKPNLEITKSLVQNQDPPQIHSMVHQQPYISNLTAYRSSSHASGNFQHPYGQVAPLLGPLGIPDLNVAAEETFGVDSPQPLDQFSAFSDNRAKAAEARRKRMVRVKEMKNSFSIIKTQRS